MNFYHDLIESTDAKMFTSSILTENVENDGPWIHHRRSFDKLSLQCQYFECSKWYIDIVNGFEVYSKFVFLDVKYSIFFSKSIISFNTIH